MNTKELDQTYIAATYARFPVELVKGKGSLVWDEQGREYIDLGTGIAVNTFGIADETWAHAVTSQLSTLQHTSNLFYSEPCVQLAQMLCEKTGMKKVFFSNSGAEANECAIKAARKYAADRYGADRHVIVTLENSFHGRTLTTLAATGQDAFHGDFLPLTPGFAYAKPNDIASLKTLTDRGNVAGILLECVQGEGGVVALDCEFLQAAQEIAREKDIVFMIDEVQTGNGRTGRLYSYMHYGLTPDVVSTAKGLAGGLPMGVTMLGEKVQDVFTPGSHGSTFGGNPVCSAGALSILERLDEDFLAQVWEKADYLFEALSQVPGVKSVTGLGLMIGVETQKDAAQVIEACRQKGVLVIKAKNKVRLLPALNIPMELLQQAVTVLAEACAV